MYAHLARALNFVVAHLQLDIRGPRVVLGLPLHPSIKNLTRTCQIFACICQHFDARMPNILRARAHTHTTRAYTCAPTHTGT